MRLIAVLLPALLAVTPVAAQVYKWVDEKGRTHYGERPPASGKSKEMPIREAAPKSDRAAGAATPSVKDQETAFRQRQVKREEEEAKAAKDTAVRERQCKSARGDLADLQVQRRVFTRNDRGEREFMSDTERESRVAQLQSEVNRFCR
ncbi:MAG: DUF4124 domain-containing protein [Burkholderiales bacterium]